MLYAALVGGSDMVWHRRSVVRSLSLILRLSVCAVSRSRRRLACVSRSVIGSPLEAIRSVVSN